jgi:hypothetical protein
MPLVGLTPDVCVCGFNLLLSLSMTVVSPELHGSRLGLDPVSGIRNQFHRKSVSAGSSRQPDKVRKTARAPLYRGRAWAQGAGDSKALGHGLLLSRPRQVRVGLGQKVQRAPSAVRGRGRLARARAPPPGLATTPIPSVSPADPCAAAAPREHSLSTAPETSPTAQPVCSARRQSRRGQGGEGTGVRDGACLPASAAYLYTRTLGEQSAVR